MDEAKLCDCEELSAQVGYGNRISIQCTRAVVFSLSESTEPLYTPANAPHRHTRTHTQTASDINTLSFVSIPVFLSRSAWILYTVWPWKQYQFPADAVKDVLIKKIWGKMTL